VKVAVLFINLGGYHAARLRAAGAACEARGWTITALQLTNDVLGHPWGNVDLTVSFPVVTLFDASETAVTRSPAAIRKRVWRALEESRPDAVAIPGWGSRLARAALTWTKHSGVAAVLMSESKRDDARRWWPAEKLKSWLWVRSFDAAVVGGERHRAYAIELGIPAARVFTGYDAVDNAYFTTEADRARREPDEARARVPQIPIRPYFLAMTRLVPRKNVRRLLDAYALYRERAGSSPCDLVVCGDGQCRAELSMYVRARGLTGSVHFPGFVPYDQLGVWYGLAAGFVHAALQEQWGLVVNEACAAGVPIAASRTVGAAAELVHDGDTGLLFDPADVEAIAATLFRLQQLSPDERNRMVEAARREVARFTPERFGSALVEAVRTAVERS